jgi:hypothetical protein
MQDVEGVTLEDWRWVSAAGYRGTEEDADGEHDERTCRSS